MTAGEKIKCPHCGEDSIVKTKPKMRNWTCVGNVLVCALCGAELGTPPREESGDASRNAGKKLAALLGEVPEPTLRLDPGSEYRHFCRNCRHRIEHPFVLRCALTGAEIDPGGCCEHFEPEEDRP